MIDGKSIRNKLIGSDDERAVSPVIGVILMVAITVILAAVIAAFVLDMGSNVGDDEAPNVVWQAEQENSVSAADDPVVTFTHQSGDPVSADSISLNVVSDEGHSFSTDISGEITSGETVVAQVDSVNDDGAVLAEGDEVSIIWNDGSSSSTLHTYTVSSDIADESGA